MHLALWTLLAAPPNEFVAAQCCIVRKDSVPAVFTMVPLLQQGMLCLCKSRVLLPSAV